ncbi:hypothetical protein TI39_contig430g00007 [Zymoseptoria brevis]|uniref:Uncharacterized protein n=1 Tax=Zymoseptoria brevis TaxID=1047168 RepID=A0A0F4GL43_9PEZI|nr:hypothetical protein TI39_contig430g00007 [Zymoseptoria brevis]
MQTFKLLALLFISSAFAMPAQDAAENALGKILVKRCTPYGNSCQDNCECCGHNCNDGGSYCIPDDLGAAYCN